MVDSPEARRFNSFLLEQGLPCGQDLEMSSIKIHHEYAETGYQGEFEHDRDYSLDLQPLQVNGTEIVAASATLVEEYTKTQGRHTLESGTTRYKVDMRALIDFFRTTGQKLD